MSKQLIQLIEKEGPGLTTKFASLLYQNGKSKEAARKQIERGKKVYKTLAGLKFRTNTRFIFLSHQYNTPKYWQRLEEALKEAGISYWTAIQVLKAHDGVVPKKLFPRIAGTPTKRKGQIPPETILQRLAEVKILKIEEFNDREYVICNEALFQPADGIEKNIQTVPNYLIKEKEISEEVILNKTKKWIQNLSIASYSKVAIRYDEANPPVVAGLSWDLTAPSYLRPFRSFANSRLKGGFVVCDVNLSHNISIDEANAFIRKCRFAEAHPNMRPVLPIFVSVEYSKKAYEELKSHGIMPVTLRQLFGQEAVELLGEIRDLLKDIGNKLSQDTNAFTSIVQKIRQEVGSNSNTLGHLFELAVAHMVRSVEVGDVKMNKKVIDSETNNSAEIDVLVENESKSEILVIECKSKAKRGILNEKQVKLWATERISLIFKCLKSEYPDKNIRFELWTNGILHSSAIEWLESLRSEVTSYSLGWKYLDDLKQYSQDKRIEAPFRNMLKECFF